MGPSVHRGPGRVRHARGAGGLASRGSVVCVGGGAMAAGGDVGVALLGRRESTSARTAARPLRTSATVGYGWGDRTTRRRWLGDGENSDVVAGVVERWREGERGTDAILTSLRSSGKCCCRWRQRLTTAARAPWCGNGGGAARVLEWRRGFVGARGQLRRPFNRLGKLGEPWFVCARIPGSVVAAVSETAGGCG